MELIPQDSTLIALRKLDELLSALLAFLDRNEIGNVEKRVTPIVELLNKSYNIPDMKQKIKEFVETHGGVYDGKDIETSIKSLYTTKAMENGVPYMGVIINEQGYIVDIVEVDEFMKSVDRPIDIARGYYKLVNGKLVIDEARRALLWGD